MSLPVNIDTTYADDAGDASVKDHQQHHDSLHVLYNDLNGNVQTIWIQNSFPSAVGEAVDDLLVHTGEGRWYRLVSTGPNVWSAVDNPKLHASTHKTGGSDTLRLDELTVPAASVVMNSQKMTGLADGVAAGEAVHWGQLTAVTHNTQTANYTLVLADRGKLVEMNVATANTLTVPPNSTAAFAIGTVIAFRQYGAGQTTLTPGAGVTIRSSGGKLKTAAVYAEGTLTKRATDEWVASGDLVA